MPQFLLFTAEDAAALAQATAERADVLEPREIIAGPHAGKWALPVRAESDPAHEDLADLLARGTVTAVDIAKAWPPEE